MPLSNHLSSARHWVPGSNVDVTRTVKNEDGEVTSSEKVEPYAGVPRPDKNLSTLWLLSLIPFGFDHFYLRSPWTGIAKLLTFGGIGLWYLWDIFQLWCEKDSVINYGLTTPFDFVTGIAQGMIVDDIGLNAKSSTYKQHTNYGFWFFATLLFGWMGLDSFVLGRFWLGWRIIIISIIALSVVIPILTVGGWSFLGIIVLVFIIPEIIAWLASWGSNVYTLVADPDSIMQDGMLVPVLAKKAAEWIRSLYVDKNGNIMPAYKADWDFLENDYMYKDIPAEELRARFWIGRPGETATISGQTSGASGIPPVKITLRIFSIAWANIVSGIKAVWYIFAPQNAIIEGIGETIINNLTAPGGAPGGAKNIIGAAAALAPGIGPMLGMITGDGATNPVSSAAHHASALPKKLASVAGGIADAVPTVASTVNMIGRSAETGLQKTVAAVVSNGVGMKPTNTPTIRSFEAPAATGGAREEPLSTEAQIMGATVLALIAGGSLKGLVDYLMKE